MYRIKMILSISLISLMLIIPSQIDEVLALESSTNIGINIEYKNIDPHIPGGENKVPNKDKGKEKEKPNSFLPSTGVKKSYLLNLISVSLIGFGLILYYTTKEVE